MMETQMPILIENATDTPYAQLHTDVITRASSGYRTLDENETNDRFNLVWK